MAKRAVHLAQGIIKLRIVAFDGDGALQHGYCPIRLAHGVQCFGELGQGGCVLGIALARVAKGGDRVAQAPGRSIGHAKAKKGFGLIRSKIARPVKRADGTVELLGRYIQRAQLPQHAHVLRIGFLGLAQGGDRFVQLAVLTLQLAQLQQRGNVSRQELGGPEHELQGLATTTEVVVNRCQQTMRLAVGGINADGLAERVHGAGNVAIGERGDRQVVMGGGQGWIQRRGAVIRSNRLFERSATAGFTGLRGTDVTQQIGGIGVVGRDPTSLFQRLRGPLQFALLSAQLG